MRKLKIGELSQLVGAPASALRFWEERGITEPEKDGDNRYRLYTAWDSCRFLMARRYRSLGFPLQEVKAMVAEADPAETAARLERRLAELEGEVKRLAAIRDELSRHNRECRDARTEIGTFVPAYLPAAWYIFTINAGRMVEDEATLELSKRWTEQLPFTAFSVLVPAEAFSGAADYTVRWGFGVEDEILQNGEWSRIARGGADGGPGGEGAHGDGSTLRDPPGTLRLDGARCVRTAFYRDDPRDMRPSELAGIVAAFRAAGYEATGPAIGRFLQIERGGDGYRYLCSLYIPIG